MGHFKPNQCHAIAGAPDTTAPGCTQPGGVTAQGNAMAVLVE